MCKFVKRLQKTHRLCQEITYNEELSFKKCKNMQIISRNRENESVLSKDEKGM